ncbi:helix-turn-helix domain-containing protein [Paludisphaera soli]|uniref:helix-turn-helix domain-containing protein n=1 Tax=Paludisphaera soli TaxID=2712865 RepID=UPI0021BC8798|nr:helix-turn-helix domain-containing protein [Paludisphaera soli]
MLATKAGVSVLASKPQRRRWRPEEIDRARDLSMLSMRRQGIPLSVIAEVFNVAKSTVCRRLAAIPEDARAHYAGRGLV